MKISGFLVLLPTVLGMAACDHTSPSEGLVGTPPIKIGGTWSYRFDVSETSIMATCQARGTVTFSPNAAGDQFTGFVSSIYSCFNGGESTGDVTAIVPVTSGELAGQAVRFIAFGCIQLGAFSGSPPNHAIGNLSCSFPITDFGPSLAFQGTWEASR